MKKLYFILLLVGLHAVAIAQNVVQLEYFIDTDAGIGSNTKVNLTPVSDGTFSFTADLTGASIGYHKLYVRTKDSDGKWSLTMRRNIHVIPGGASNDVVSAEYFFDTDPGQGAGTVVAVSPQSTDITQNYTAVTSALTPGYHKLYTRTKDAQGNWSLTGRRNFEVLPPDVNGIVSAEYFFDADPGQGNGTPVTISPQDTDISKNFTATTSALTPGYHKLYLRSKDQQGKWSLTGRRNVEVISNDGPLVITGTEFSFGTDPGVGNGTYIAFATALADGTFSFTIPQNQVPDAEDTLYLRVKDSPNNNWSNTKTVAKNFITTNCGENIWTGTISTDWHTAGNWSCNGVPGETTDVVINRYTPFNCEVLTGNAAVCHKITAVLGSNVKINAGATLSVKGN